MKYHVPTILNFLGDLMRFFTKKSRYHQGFFAVKRRTVFILGAMWIALVRGWRRDCVAGGMETRFQWRKAHSRTAKCEAFHVAPRLFFMFLFLIPFTIRQHCIIYAPRNFPQNPLKSYLHRLLMPCVHQSNWSTLTANQLSPSQTNGGGIWVCFLWGWGVGGL